MTRIARCVLALGLLAMSCEQNGPTAAPSSGSSGDDPPVSVSPVVDRLVGEWRQDFSCEDNVTTFHRLVLIDYDEAFYRKWVRDFAWGPHAATATRLTAKSLCEGARDHFRVMKVEGGVITLFDGMSAVPSNPATYQLLNDHTLTLNDGGIDIADCDETGCTMATYEYTFSLVADRLTIELQHQPHDPWGGTPFEVAPFYRVT